jgi:DNA-binding winged helix-turn-helix (wHTH) protein
MRLDLGSVTLDMDRHQVFRGEEPVHLSTKGYQLLALLVEKRPRAISKDEIQRALWPDTFVSDTSLTTLVNEVRTVLSDNAKEHRLIRTVHGFGYAFEGDARAAPIARCRLVWGDRDLPLEEGENILGRDPSARGSIPDASLSRRHARISIDETGASIEDLGSKNGTYIDGKKVRGATALADREVIKVGPAALTLRVFKRTGSTRSTMKERPSR